MRVLKLVAVCLAAVLVATGCAQVDRGGSDVLSPDDPITISMWHYYNGAQQEALIRLVEEFNETAGQELGIVVEQFSQASVTDLEQSVLAAANREVGASDIPDIFAAYADTAYAVDRLGLVADLRPYFTDEEIAEYVDGYIEEGAFSGEDTLKIFPTAKSVELFLLNETDWRPFAEATGAEEDAFATFEGITRTAREYYEWTDSQTPDVPNDGKAFFGRDAFANYMIIGARQLGVELLSVDGSGAPVLNFDRAAVRRLWDNYYVPYVNGWFAANGRFRSDDVKMGGVISFVGSSSGATFFPDERIISDNESYPIEMRAFQSPRFEGGEAYAVQQGAGMVVTSGGERKVRACVEFLKWFTDSQRNLEFSIGSGYLPVKKEANGPAFVSAAMDAADTEKKLRAVLTAAIETAESNSMYTTKAFSSGTAAREILETAMPRQAQADREAFLALLDEGLSREDAAQQIVTDEAFNAWYEETLQQLEACLRG